MAPRPKPCIHLLEPLAADYYLTNKNIFNFNFPGSTGTNGLNIAGRPQYICPFEQSGCISSTYKPAVYCIPLQINKAKYKHCNISADKQQDNFYHMVIYNAVSKLKNLTFIYIYIKTSSWHRQQ